MNKVTVNANNLDDFSIDSWTINRDPEVGREEPEVVAVEHNGKAYQLKFYATPQDKPAKVTVDVWSLTNSGELDVPIKEIVIDNGGEDE